MPNLFVSSATVVTIVIGIVITFFYLRYMWLVLQRVAQTLDAVSYKHLTLPTICSV